MFCSKHASVLYVLTALSAVAFALPKPQEWVSTVDWTKVDYTNGAGNGGPVTTPPAKEVPAVDEVPEDPTPVVEQPATTTPEVIPTPVPTSADSGSGSGSGSDSESSSNVTPPSGGKRGLAYNYESPSLDIFNGSPNIGWGWNWASTRGDLPEQFEFVPMLWSPSKLGNFHSDMESSTPSYILSFNEPDIVGQCDIPVGDAVKGHIELLNQHASDSTKIGAVSVSNGKDPNKPMGLDYLKDFLEQCGQQPEPCVVDFCPVHWYGCPASNPCSVADDFAAFQTQMSDAIDACNGMPIWLTEFQKIGDEAQQKEFIELAIPFLEGESKIERYSYFMVKDGMMTTGGQLNEAGKAFTA